MALGAEDKAKERQLILLLKPIPCLIYGGKFDRLKEGSEKAGSSTY